METALIVLGAFAVFVGFVGCVAPLIPGPIVGFCGLLCLLATEGHRPSAWVLVTMGALIVAVTVADYVVPALGAKRFNCTRWGTTGCFVGTVAGMFFVPLGLVVGPFLGAFVGELISGRSLRLAVRGGVGALLGFLSGVFIKVVACIALAVCFVLCVV